MKKRGGNRFAPPVIIQVGRAFPRPGSSIASPHQGGGADGLRHEFHELTPIQSRHPDGRFRFVEFVSKVPGYFFTRNNFSACLKSSGSGAVNFSGFWVCG